MKISENGSKAHFSHFELISRFLILIFDMIRIVPNTLFDVILIYVRIFGDIFDVRESDVFCLKIYKKLVFLV